MSARRSVVARWTDWTGTGREYLVLREGAYGIIVESMAIGPTANSFALRYRIECDSGWRVRGFEAELLGGKRLALRGNGNGRWFDARGRRLAALDGAIDIDISATPFTNTLPIRRLKLRRGQSAEIAAVYIRVPELSIARDPQRYTRLAAGRYRYESLDSDFMREIDVDARGLVRLYPGLFRRA